MSREIKNWYDSSQNEFLSVKPDVDVDQEIFISRLEIVVWIKIKESTIIIRDSFLAR